ncbi:hypothetical protein [Sphingomicrobium lutaoense]|uniref:Precorrin-6B methylase 2 n=1 Tax=Sphingomicrobium lutaoense TaxID=515949 RepID=A0A839YYY8_9SPHN|nr:hypothetical protein [Sphingomicrobium lutaoense]MBB3762987.1 precorrin-6B methylase 2 [Sphingomicrobium lutaoense]
MTDYLVLHSALPGKQTPQELLDHLSKYPSFSQLQSSAWFVGPGLSAKDVALAAREHIRNGETLLVQALTPDSAVAGVNTAGPNYLRAV